LVSSTVELNGKRLEMGAQDQLPAIPLANAGEEINLAPANIHFLPCGKQKIPRAAD
jgi:hypothetical protein